MKHPDPMTIGEISRRTGLAVSAIRYYEAEGLIAPARSSGGQRIFKRADIRRLSFVMICQQLGFPLSGIRQAMEQLPANRTPNKSDWTRLSKQFRTELDQRIESLIAMRDRLDGCIGCGCLSLARCSLYNPGDRAAENGPGPRYLLGEGPDDA